MRKLGLYLCFIFCVLSSLPCNGQTPPQVTVVGDQVFCGDAPMPIATEVSISGGSGDLNVVYLQIVTGYNLGLDTLITKSHLTW